MKELGRAGGVFGTGVVRSRPLAFGGSNNGHFTVNIRLLATLSRLFTTKQFTPDDRMFRAVIQHGYGGVKELGPIGARSTGPGSGPSGRKTTGPAGPNGPTATGGLNNLVHSFNNTSIQATVGYGSGVFAQAGYDKNSVPQVDMIHIVENTRGFHRQNLALFPNHYSGLRWGGIRLIEMFQNLGLVKIYFNPYVLMNKTIIKYGVISETLVLQDMLEWRTLYLAGRLQKPVKFMGTASHWFQTLNQFNLRSAVKIALLMSKTKTISEKELYETITLISYLGDSRMLIGGENPHKIRNIVAKQLQQFQNLYGPILAQFEAEKYLKYRQNRITIAEFTTHQKKTLIETLPLQYRNRLLKNYNQTHNGTDNSITQLVQEPDLRLRELYITTLKQLVLTPSIMVSVKGIFTAGVFKSVRYMIDKRLKYLQPPK